MEHHEEVGDPLDYALQAALSEFYPGPMATGENLFSHQDARNLLGYGGMRPDRDDLQFDWPCPMACVNTCVPSRCWSSLAGHLRAAFHTVASNVTEYRRRVGIGRQ